MERWRVGPGETGQRLDSAVAERCAAPRNQVQAWIREGLVTVDGTVRRASHRLEEGSRIACSPRPKATAAHLRPEPGDLALLHEDADLLVIDKPSGLAVHPGAGRPAGTLANRLLHAYPELASVGGAGRPGIVHRLDLDTTGVLVVARTEAAYQSLSRAFAERRVAKIYRAIVFGTPRPAAGVIELAVGRHPLRRKEMTVREDGRPARTRYRVLDAGAGIAFLELALETGRTHQIRVHLKAIRHPLVGDPTYAGNRARGAPREVRGALAGFARPALHALAVELEHPTRHETMRFTAPLPADLAELWLTVTGRPLPAAR
ncbi:MAG: RluA family pseudouridine synthase [Acidobacteriota bacterium]|nr:RluA family pseudouridine synthase [Acidobacteriota bacterium]MDH3524872.1 RluA family pseudouridine synthase [Acidobacteriota bacterium]